MERTIFHVDVNSAFLSWEAVYRIKHLYASKDIREIPSAVGGDMEQRHGIILAKSMPAKKYGIQTGETLIEARRKCPDLLIVPPHYQLYEKSSKAFIDILKEYTPNVEQYSIDEAFLDMTGMKSLFGEPMEVAENIKDRIYNELGFTVNVGVSSNKLLSKMASDFRKPNLVHSLYPNEIEAKMWPLPVSELFFVGRATTKKLFNLGIKTIGDLAKSDISLLKYHLKKQGEIVHAFANGKDISLVENVPPPRKGYGNSTTIAFDVNDADTAKIVLLALSEKVGTRLRNNDVKAEVLTVGIKSFDLRYASHQMVLKNSTNITKEIHKEACKLFDELWDGIPIRHLGVHASRIVENEKARQITLFDNEDYGKLQKVDKAVDDIRKRFGTDAVMRATFVKSPIDHMSGGISREKLTVDYSKIKLDDE